MRVIVDEFTPSRNLRRVIAANRGLKSVQKAPNPTAEQYSLFRDYIDARHGEGGMADMSVLDYAQMVEDTVVDTFVTEYRVRPPIDRGRAGENDGELIGVALCDRLSDGISMVYSFYDADDARRSLGSFIILDHIEYARRLGLPYVYLGYWISGSRKMRYKTRFKPQERLGPNGWERV